MAIFAKAQCQHCQHERITYERKFNSGMAASLVVLFRATNRLQPPDGWLHVPDSLTDKEARIVLKGREHARLRFWALAESRPNSDGSNSSGEWRVTPSGLLLAANPSMTIPRWVYEENSVVKGFSNGCLINGVATRIEQTSLLSALGDDFDYQELIS